MVIRPRRDDDLERLVTMATVVHREDHYPVYLADDLGSFVVVPGALGAWVAERGPDIVGHVALHRRGSKPVMALLAEAGGIGPEDVGVVARLLVASPARGTGVAQQLLETATRYAHSLGRRPVLDVVVTTQSAIRLYERCGWQRLGTITATFPGGSVDEYVYLGPAAES
jgi:GNAT superfamily N-acetyltransferase